MPATFTWFLGGAQAGNWNEQNNWRDENMNAGVPGANDTAVFEPNGNQGTAPVNVNVNSTVRQLLIRSTYAGTITLANSLTIDSGQGAQVTSEMAGGTVAGVALLAVNNAVFRWVGGTIDGGGMFQIGSSASLNIEGDNAKVLDRRNLRNYGTINWSGSGEIQLRHAARIDVGWPGSNAVFNVNASNTAIRTVDASQPSIYLPQHSRLNMNSSGWIEVDANLSTDLGLINVQAGQLWLLRTSVIVSDGNIQTTDDRVTLGASGEIGFLGNVTLRNAELRGAGWASFGSLEYQMYPTVQLEGTVVSVQNVDDWSNAVQGGTTLRIDGGTYLCQSGQWLGGAQARVEVLAGAQLKLWWSMTMARNLLNSGTIVFEPAGDVTVQNGARIENLGGSVFDVRNNRHIRDGGGAGQFLVRANATLQKTAGGGETRIDLNWRNEGMTREPGGRIRFTAQAVNAGLMELSNGGLAFDSNLTQESTGTIVSVNAPIDITGYFQMDGGTVDVEGATVVVTGNYKQDGGNSAFTTGSLLEIGAKLLVNAGTASLDCMLEVANNYEQTGGTARMGADAVAISGQALLWGGTLTLDGPITVTSGMEILADGLLEIGADGAVSGNVINSGVISVGAQAAGQTLIISGNFTQTSNGKLRLQLGIASDHVGIGGHASLAGTLEVGLEDGFSPSGGSFSPISWGSFSGAFVILLPPLPEPEFWIEDYGEFSLDLYAVLA